MNASRNQASAPVIDLAHTYTLPELIDIAEASSPASRIAWTEAKRAMELAGVDRALYLPLLSLELQGSDARTIVPFPKPIAPRGYVTAELPAAVGQLELGYTLLDFSRASTVSASKAREIGSTLRFGRVQQDLAYTTAARYYDAQQAMGQLDAAKTVLLTAQTLLSNAQSQFDNGRATIPDLQNAQAGAAEAQYNVASAEGDARKAKLALTEAIGVEPSPAIQIPSEDQAHSAEELNASIEDLLQTAWKSRPDLLARAQDLRSAKEDVRSAHAAYLPKVKLQLAGGETATWPTADFGQLGYANVSTWSASAGLRWDIFNGARGHELASAVAAQKAATEEQRAAHDAVTRQVWDAYVDFQTAVEQERSSRAFLAAAQTSYDSSLDAYKYGVRSLVDVVQAEQQLAQARFTSVRAYVRLMQSGVALRYATGELVQPPSPEGNRP
ncbi:TolC family protein [Granulicella sp. 5B5]|uniref:TolC family protein n=1 Tax=Granulicella sp. 5B5 TaxID=1617967 RepID=UPI0015F37C3E|nr:TolC family protein [Granulicella sp. 5B5]